MFRTEWTNRTSSQTYSVPPVPTPELQIPPLSSTIVVRLLHPLASRQAPVSDLFSPLVPGLNTITLPSHSFLISHTPPDTYGPTHVLFDLYIRKNWRTGFRAVFTILVTLSSPSKALQFDFYVSQDVTTLLSHSTDPPSSPSSGPTTTTSTTEATSPSSPRLSTHPWPKSPLNLLR